MIMNARLRFGNPCGIDDIRVCVKADREKRADKGDQSEYGYARYYDSGISRLYRSRVSAAASPVSVDA